MVIVMGAVMQIIVIRHHPLHKELVIAIAVASVAILIIVVSTLCAWILWRRARQTYDSKDIQSSGFASFKFPC